ncbi:MAG: hypothetical protein JXL84_11070 [Deltaproteobacteria bacterium]|nr:hypothetical protein [Deltaproteobacteria bacterium]
MIRNRDLLEDFEKAEMRKARPDYFRNLEIFEALYREARGLGVFPPKDPLEGMEADLRLAEALNVRTPARKNRSRPG